MSEQPVGPSPPPCQTCGVRHLEGEPWVLTEITSDGRLIMQMTCVAVLGDYAPTPAVSEAEVSGGAGP